MKQLLLLVLFILSMSPCRGANNELKGRTHFILSGNIKNFKSNKIILNGFDFTKKIKFNVKENTFSFTFHVDSIASGNYNLKVKERDISFYIDGENDLSIMVDAESELFYPIFTGDNNLVKINNYLNKKRKTFIKIVGSSMKLFVLDEDSFIKKLKEYSRAIIELLKESKLERSFRRKEARSVHHFYDRSFNNYEKLHTLVLGDDDFEASDDFRKDIKKLNFDSEMDYRFSVDYRLSLDEYIEARSVEKIKKIEEEEGLEGDLDMTMLDMINEKVSNKFVKNRLLYNIAKRGIVVTTDLDMFYNKVNSYCTNKEDKAEITKLFKKFKAIYKGEPSPKFGKLKNFNGGETSLDDIIDKGKYIYIDVWASWCGFCKKENPILKNVEEKYHGSNLEFLSINVNALSDMKSWKKDVETKKMAGIQLFAGQETKEFEFAKKYIIEGLPRFILLDPKGRIITPNAPRPTNGYELDMLFEKHGIQKVNE